jgi:hypothetical protein
MGSKQFSLDKADLLHLLKVVAYSGISAALAALAASLGDIDVPVKYAMLVPVVNTVLVSLQRFFAKPS